MEQEVFIPNGYISFEDAILQAIPLSIRKNHDIYLRKIKALYNLETLNKNALASRNPSSLKARNSSYYADLLCTINTREKRIEELRQEVDVLKNEFIRYNKLRKDRFNALRQQGYTGELAIFILDLKNGNITKCRKELILQDSFENLINSKSFLVFSEKTINAHSFSNRPSNLFVLVRKNHIAKKTGFLQNSSTTGDTPSNHDHIKILLDAKALNESYIKKNSRFSNNIKNISETIANNKTQKPATIRRILTKYKSIWMPNG